MTFPSVCITTTPLQSDKDLVQLLIKYKLLEQTVTLPHLDVTIISPLEAKTSISIDQIHMLTRTASFAPRFLPHSLVIITPADALTLPAQQALLKTLEEPPNSVQFVLLTHTPYILLPTILSRCILIGTEESVQSKTTHTFVSPHTEAECIALCDTHGQKREDALLFLQELIQNCAQDDIRIRPRAIETIRLLKQNVHVKLALDQFFFSLIA